MTHRSNGDGGPGTWKLEDRQQGVLGSGMNKGVYCGEGWGLTPARTCG